MRSGIENKKNRVTSLLFKINIASTPPFSVQTAHFHKAVHRFALVLCMPSVCDLSSKFKESGICIHTLLGVPISNQPRTVILLPIHFVQSPFQVLCLFGLSIKFALSTGFEAGIESDFMTSMV
jgi:hypothetical protein